MQISTIKNFTYEQPQEVDGGDYSDNDFFDETDESSELYELKEELANLELKYTDRHPDVIKVKMMIEKLEKDEKHNLESTELDNHTEDAEEFMYQPDPKELLLSQRNDLSTELSQINGDISKLKTEIKLYKLRIDNTPIREQELVDINRDYENVKKQYNTILNRKLEAEIAVNMEKKQKGEQFKVLDYAKIPEKPKSPSVKKLFLISLAAGLGIGGGLIYLLEFLPSTIKRKDDIELGIGVPTLAVIPKLTSPKKLMLERINSVLTLISCTSVVTLCAGFAIFALKGIDPTIEYIQKFVKF
jgi:uncharacterized protein involved in exopolysaccharide biosynthesis